MDVEALGVQIQEQEAQLPELREAAKAEPSEDQAGVLKKLAADIKKANQSLEKVGCTCSSSVAVNLSCWHNLRLVLPAG